LRAGKPLTENQNLPLPACKVALVLQIMPLQVGKQEILFNGKGLQARKQIKWLAA